VAAGQVPPAPEQNPACVSMLPEQLAALHWVAEDV
jgi:hypothetical protein